MNKFKKYEDEILNGSIMPTLIVLSFPLVMNQILATLYNMVDSYYMGKLGNDALTAIAMTFPIFQMIISLGAGFSMGGMVIFSKNIGAGNFEENRRAKSQLITTNLLFAAFIMIICYSFYKPLLVFCGATENLLEICTAYLRVLFLTIPFMFIINVYSAIENSKGNTFAPMIRIFISTILNAIFNSYAVRNGYGVVGIAFGTVLANFILVVYCIIFMWKNNDISWKYIKMLDIKLALNFIKIGIPIALSNALANAGFIITNKSVIGFGDDVLAGFGIGNRINNIFSTPANAMVTSISIMVAQNLGAKKFDRVKEIFKKSLLLSVYISIFLFFIQFFGANYFAKIFSSDVHITKHTVNFLRVFSFGGIVWAIFQAYVGYFQGHGKTKINFWVNLLRVWLFRVPFIYLFEWLFNSGAYSVWFAMLVGNIMSLPIAFYAYKKYYQKKVI